MLFDRNKIYSLHKLQQMNGEAELVGWEICKRWNVKYK